ncbi:hypothetical protein CHUAL_010846 [Chamberlinius hualienensis]
MANRNFKHLQLWDYVSFSCLVTLSSMFGIYHIYKARNAKATREFLVTSKDIGILPLIVSLVATYYSAISLLGTPLETYFNGPSFMTVAFAFIVNAAIGSLVFIPVFYKLNGISIFEGGFKAVVWADVAQCSVMLFVLLFVIIKGVINVGGLTVIWERLKAGKRDEIIILSSSSNSQYTLWTMTIGVSFHLLSFLVINQSLMQRYLSNKSLRNAQISMASGNIGMVFGILLLAAIGLLMYANYYLCDPLISGDIKKSDQLLAFFAVETLSFCQGLPGVFVAGILCATLSTLSSTLNSLSAVTLSDYIKPFKPDLTDAATLKLSKILVIFYGGLCIALVALAELMGNVARASYSIYGLTGGPVLTLFTIGMLLPWANSKNALISAGLSAIIPWWAWLGNCFTTPPIPHAPFSIEGCLNTTNATTTKIGNQELSVLQQFYGIPSFWYISWSLIIGLLVSLAQLKLTGTQNPKRVSSDLLFPFMRKYGSTISNLSQDINIHVNKTQDKTALTEDVQTMQPLLSTVSDQVNNKYN